VIRVEPATNKAVVCYQCRKPPCGNRCPAHAITYDETRGIVVVDEKECVGCGICVEDCPFGAIKIHSSTGRAIKCDLCHGSYSAPACVEFCAPGVLQFMDTDTLAHKKAGNYAHSSVKPEQKSVV
jgi:carbon-monoxide dehydrogenase iron sulfur subunit